MRRIWTPAPGFIHVSARRFYSGLLRLCSPLLTLTIILGKDRTAAGRFASTLTMRPEIGLPKVVQNESLSGLDKKAQSTASSRIVVAS